ncbi:MAG: DNA adenine methylase [Aquincola sp.]|nr:DNA adenine methylase [Aquincola sp.]
MSAVADLFETVRPAETLKRRSAALRYPGSKWSLAQEIVSQFGAHYHYVEPYFGSGAVFFSKPVSPHELNRPAF